MKTETLRLYGPVGMMFQEAEKITASGVAEQLDALRAKGVQKINAYLSSDGGSVGEGLAVHDQIKRYPGEVTIHVDGRAVSIASVIALAGARLVMPKSALLMIHAPFNFAVGNSMALRKMADDLDVMATTMRGIYSAATGLPDEKVREIMDAETWFTAEQAFALGFADEITEDQKRPAISRAAAAGPSLLDLYQKTPGSLRAAAASAALARLESTLMRQRIEETRGSAARPGTPGTTKRTQHGDSK
jgi:ATP-dependent Clp protease protease subunit